MNRNRLVARLTKRGEQLVDLRVLRSNRVRMEIVLFDDGESVGRLKLDLGKVIQECDFFEEDDPKLIADFLEDQAKKLRRAHPVKT